MGGADEDWVNAAITDAAMVAELLVRLHRSPLPPPKPAAFRLEWTVRQRRSKAATPVNNKPRKPGRGHRASPTTPLTWSDATTSFSGRSDESTRPIAFNPSASTRSKNNVDGEKTNSKRSRKKKTLAELKDEESSLLKERRELKREMSALRMNLERERATHEKLKRMKIDLQPSPESTSAPEESVSGQLQMESTARDPTTTSTTTSLTMPVVSGSNVLELFATNAHSNGNADEESDSKFILPDLNIPFDEPCCSATVMVSAS
ncbi:hypothetical protein SASPL_107986 [Salvia splendens]|uniref:Uncharacterized protein n=1 Tax=Salvia splendens TaxID=180675 RepID=A0A8X9A7T8_SALSN|nr:uncharacterized protein LOC121797271 [Salvia splendens]KAG6429929.1 hypothetical protein SASPL_107986 [Salvia splendens]